LTSWAIALLGHLELLGRGFEPRRVEGDLVDVLGELHHRAVAAVAHLFHDACHGLHEGREIGLGALEQRLTLGQGELLELEEVDHRLVSSAWT
jgi:hypothetical protein